MIGLQMRTNQSFKKHPLPVSLLLVVCSKKSSIDSIYVTVDVSDPPKS